MKRFLPPLVAFAAIAVIASTAPPRRDRLPRPLAGALGAIEGWLDRTDGLVPCGPDAIETRTGPRGFALDVPACWTLTADGALADPGLPVLAQVDAPLEGEAGFAEALADLGMQPDPKRAGRIGGRPLALSPGDASARAVLVYFVTDSAALRVQVAVPNEFGLAPAVERHLERLERVARSARARPAP